MKLKWIDVKLNKRILFIFIISLCIQISFFIIIQLSNWISQKPVDEPWFTFLTQTVEPYSDYKIWYQTFASQTLYEGWLPYLNILNIYVPEAEWYNFWFVYHEELFLNFIYPPFFYYILILPSLISVDFVFLPLLLANVFLPILIYKFLRNNFNRQVSEWGFIATCFNPLYIFYGGGLALNVSLITIFFVLTLYYISKNRFGLSIICLSISILFKQIMLLLVPPIVAYLAINSINNKIEVNIFNYLKKILFYCGIIVIILFFGSMPWILIAPVNYLSTMFSPGVQAPTLLPIFHFPYPYYNFPIFWYDFLYWFQAPYIVFWIFGFLNFTYIGIVALEFVMIIMIFYWKKRNILNWVKFLDILIYTLFLSYLFFPRGLYKYYFSFYIPMLIIWVTFHFGDTLSSKNSKKFIWILISIGISIFFMFLPRTLYLLLIWALFFYILMQNRSLMKRQKDIKINKI